MADRRARRQLDYAEASAAAAPTGQGAEAAAASPFPGAWAPVVASSAAPGPMAPTAMAAASPPLSYSHDLTAETPSPVAENPRPAAAAAAAAATAAVPAAEQGQGRARARARLRGRSAAHRQPPAHAGDAPPDALPPGEASGGGLGSGSRFSRWPAPQPRPSYVQTQNSCALGNGALEAIRDGKETVMIRYYSFGGFSEGVHYSCLREIAVLKQVRHPNVIELLEATPRSKGVAAVFPYFPHNLGVFVRQSLAGGRRPGDWNGTCRHVFHGVVAGLEYLHRHCIMHRDILPRNIMVSADQQQVKIANFHLARKFEFPMRTYTHEIVTLWYRPPEILLFQRHYTPSVDMWSAGMVLAEIINGLPLLPGDSEIDQLFLIFRNCGTPTDQSWPGVSKLPNYKASFPSWSRKLAKEMCPLGEPAALDLLEVLLVCNPAGRATAKAALDHPYLTPPDAAAADDAPMAAEP